MNPLGAVKTNGSIFPTLSNSKLVRNSSASSVKSLQAIKRNYSTASLSAQDSAIKSRRISNKQTSQKINKRIVLVE